MEIDICPLGITDCMPNFQGHYHHPWASCPNARYCRRACEDWELPLKHLGNKSYWKVLFHKIPYYYSRVNYKRYMKKYGYAEAEEMPIFYLPNSSEVNRNLIKFGFAIAMPLIDIKRFPNLYKYQSHYSVDKDGLWWYGDRRTLKSVLAATLENENYTV